MGNPLHLIETKNANKECIKKKKKDEKKENPSSFKHNSQAIIIIKKPSKNRLPSQLEVDISTIDVYDIFAALGAVEMCT